MQAQLLGNGQCLIVDFEDMLAAAAVTFREVILARPASVA